MERLPAKNLWRCYARILGISFRGHYLVFAAAITVALSGCVKISGSLSSLTKPIDFMKSEMIVRNTAIADGSDSVTVYIHLLNSNNTVVSDFKPEYQITSGANVIPSECFRSDSNGLSICVLKATTAGSRTMKVTNITTIDLHKDVTFLPVTPTNHVVRAVAGSNQFDTAGPYKVKGTVGDSVGGTKQVSTNGRYTLFGSVQSVLIQGGGN